MIPSRGLRWSSQAIGIGRRRLETFSARQFSSVQNTPSRSSPLLSSKGASILRTSSRFQFSRSNTLIRNGAAVRFASTSPAVASAATPEAIPSELTTSSLDNALDFNSDSLYDIPEHIGYLHSLGLDYGYGPTSCMQWLVEHVHIYAGTPWWISIAITAVVVRAALFKPYIAAADNASRYQAISHIMKPISTELSAAMRAGDRVRGTQLRQELQLIQRRAGIRMWKSFVPALQMFAGYGTFILFRAMANIPVPGLETGGALWFHNLAIPDPFFILPLATASMLHWVLRKGGETGSSTLSPEMQKIFMWGLPAITVIFTWWLPAALQLSFFVSGVLSYGQSSLFKWGRFREWAKMTPLDPIPSSSTPTPSVYKGEMKVRAPLTTAELDKSFQEGRKTGILDLAKKRVESVVDPIAKVAKKGNNFVGGLDERRAKAEKQTRDAYEKRRSKEVQQERRQERMEKARLKREKRASK